MYPAELEIKNTTESNNSASYLDLPWRVYLIRYARAYSSYECFILRAARLSSKLLDKSTSGSFMVDMGISSNIMKSPSPKCYMTSCDMVIYSDTLNWSDITPIFEPITELDLITNFDLITIFREVSIKHCNGCG